MASTVTVTNKGDDSSKDKEIIELEDRVTCYECYSLFWKAKIITVEPVVFLYMLGMSFIVSFIFQYFFQRYARDQLPQSVVQHDFCITDDYLNTTAGDSALDTAEDHATYLTFLVSLTSFLMTAVSTVLMGPLTDHFGRRFALASVNFGSMISSLLVMIIVYKELDLYYFIGANLVSSILGGFGVLFAAAYAYIADVSTHQTRSLRIGILELMIYISSALTSVLVGIWLSEVDCNFTSLTWAPFICFMLNLLYTLFVLPESVSKAQTQPTGEKSGGNKVKILWKGILLYFRPRLVTLKLWICLGVILIVTLNATGSVTINTYFYIHRPLKWDPDQIGLYGGYSQVTHGLALLLVMPVALIIGVPDVVLAITGVLLSCLSYLLIANVTKTWQMYAITSFQGIEAVVIPSIHSMMSKYVSKDEQGALFAIIASVDVIATLIGSSVYTNLYPMLHQKSYFIMSVLAMIPIIPLCLVLLMEVWAKRSNCCIKDKQQQLINSVSCTDEVSPLLTS